MYLVSVMIVLHEENRNFILTVNASSTFFFKHVFKSLESKCVSSQNDQLIHVHSISS